MARKITENSQILTRQEAITLASEYSEKWIFDTKHFKGFIGNQLGEIILDKGYYNEAGIRAMGELLTKGVESEVTVESDSDGRKRYRCVKFEDGTFGCTCFSFLTHHNVTKPKGECKHLKVLVDKGTF